MHSTRHPFFDFLRLTAVLLVITSHYAYMFDTSTLITFPREYLTGGAGRLGVSLFFMISGALAYISLTRYRLREYYVKRACSILIPYNVVYFISGLILLALGLYFRYPYNPLEEVLTGEREILSLLPTVIGIDHYMHGIWGINTAYLTGEWFIGCIILLYAIAPLIFQTMQRMPLLTMIVTITISILSYDNTFINPYWSAQVRISDFTFGMFFLHFQPWFRKWRVPVALTGIAVILTGCIIASLSEKTFREMLFPLAPGSLIFSAAFLLILYETYALIEFFSSRIAFLSIAPGLAARAYIIMLIQHVVIIFVSSNIDTAKLDVGQAILFYILTLITIERFSAMLKKIVSSAEICTVKWMLGKFLKT